MEYRIANAVKRVGRVDKWQESGGPLEEGLSELSEREQLVLSLEIMELR
jgi:hypothetical protein